MKTPEVDADVRQLVVELKVASLLQVQRKDVATVPKPVAPKKPTRQRKSFAVAIYGHVSSLQ